LQLELLEPHIELLKVEPRSIRGLRVAVSNSVIGHLRKPQEVTKFYLS